MEQKQLELFSDAEILQWRYRPETLEFIRLIEECKLMDIEINGRKT